MKHNASAALGILALALSVLSLGMRLGALSLGVPAEATVPGAGLPHADLVMAGSFALYLAATIPILWERP